MFRRVLRYEVASQKRDETNGELREKRNEMCVNERFFCFCLFTASSATGSTGNEDGLRVKESFYDALELLTRNGFAITLMGAINF